MKTDLFFHNQTGIFDPNIFRDSYIETDPKKTGQGRKLTTNRNSPIFELSLRNLVKMTYYYGGPFG